MASYRQYRHLSSSEFGRPDDMHLFDWVNDPFTRWQLSQAPFIGGFYKAMDQQKFYNDYLRNRGMTWKNVKYPALLGGQTALGAGYNAGADVLGMAVSRNILRLYR